MKQAVLFLVRARNVELLNQLVQRLNDIQRDSGDVKELITCKYQNASYVCRVETKGKTFYYINGAVLAFSPQEAAIRRVIDLDRSVAPAESVSAGEGIGASGAEDTLVALWINPHVFEPEIERTCKQAEGAEAVVRKAVLSYWKALESAALLAYVARKISR